MVLEKTHKVILVNDDSNNFDYVMACLIRYCDHDPVQAEQAALIAHHNGKCDVASGSFNEMYDLMDRLQSLALVAEIGDYEGNMYK
jgi:ATP-dependent Clp protease adaptor protein ClpS